MRQEEIKYKTIPFPRSRNIVVDMMENGLKVHHAWGFGEVDVTIPRKMIADFKLKTGQDLSFTAFILHSIGKVLDDHKEVIGIRRGKKIVIFDEIDSSTIVERETPEGIKVPSTIIVRAINKKTFEELNNEIRNAQKVEFKGMSLGSSENAKKASKLANLPKIIRNLIWIKMRRDPVFRNRMIGTMNLTAVGMFGTKGGWALSTPFWNLTIVVGGIVKRPTYEGEKIIPHEFLCLSVIINHDIIDGAPAARFIAKVIERIEKGIDLPS